MSLKAKVLKLDGCYLTNSSIGSPLMVPLSESLVEESAVLADLFSWS